MQAGGFIFRDIVVAGGSPHLGQEGSGGHHSPWARLTSTPLSITGFAQSSQLHSPTEARYSWTSHSRPCGTHRCLRCLTAIAAASASSLSPSTAPLASASIPAALSAQMRELGLSSGTGVEKVCSFLLLLLRIGAAKAYDSPGPFSVLIYQPSPASRRPCTAELLYRHHLSLSSQGPRGLSLSLMSASLRPHGL